MTNENAKLVIIYTESALESQLVKDIERIGAPGYTISNARGKGARGLRGASWEANSNIKVEVICSSKVADELMEYMQETYYDNYAMVTYCSDIHVLRPEKFTS